MAQETIPLTYILHSNVEIQHRSELKVDHLQDWSLREAGSVCVNMFLLLFLWPTIIILP